ELDRRDATILRRTIEVRQSDQRVDGRGHRIERDLARIGVGSDLEDPVVPVETPAGPVAAGRRRSRESRERTGEDARSHGTVTVKPNAYASDLVHSESSL